MRRVWEGALMRSVWEGAADAPRLRTTDDTITREKKPQKESRRQTRRRAGNRD